MFMNLPSEFWNQARALEGLGGVDEFLSELAGICSAACLTLLKSLEDSIAEKNFLSAAITAHLLGRAARSLAATQVGCGGRCRDNGRSQRPR
jgi:hypothetical protein